MESTEQVNDRAGKGRLSEAVGVPRQYGVGTLLLITAMYALLFGALKSLRSPPAAFAIVGVFPACIGLAQMLLFGGKRPREASIIAGSIFFVLASIILFLTIPAGARGSYGVFVIVIVAPAMGAFFGYLVGAAVGGVFLIANWIERWRETVEPKNNEAEAETGDRGSNE